MRWWACPNRACTSWEWAAAARCSLCAARRPRWCQEPAARQQRRPARGEAQGLPPTPPPPPLPRGGGLADADMGDPSAGGEELRQRLAAAERTLRGLVGDHWAPTRAALQDQIRAWREEHHRALPKSTRLRGMQEGLDRRKARQDRLRGAQAQDQALLEGLDAQCDKEVAELRARFAHKAFLLKQQMDCRLDELKALDEEVAELTACQVQLVEEGRPAAPLPAGQGPPTPAALDLETAMRGFRQILELRAVHDPNHAKELEALCSETVLGVSSLVQTLAQQSATRQPPPPATQPATLLHDETPQLAQQAAASARSGIGDQVTAHLQLTPTEAFPLSPTPFLTAPPQCG